MLPKENRLRDRTQFGLVVRKGKRTGNKYLVIHHLTGQFGISVPLVGFVVSKKQIPHAVDRNRVKRQLRALFRNHPEWLGADEAVVVRVNKAACQVSTEVLERALTKLLARLETKQS